jgi:periplasmic divalent cation tolerance protein
MELLVVFCTFPDVENAREIGTALVESQLAACVNLLPGVESIYSWKGTVERGSEVLALFKTTREAWPEFETRLKELHPYEVPEIVAIKPELVSAAYARWVDEAVVEQEREFAKARREAPL